MTLLYTLSDLLYTILILCPVYRGSDNLYNIWEPQNDHVIYIVRSSIYWTQNQILILCPIYKGSDIIIHHYYKENLIFGFNYKMSCYINCQIPYILDTKSNFDFVSNIQEVFHVYLNKFENSVTHLFLVIFSNNWFQWVSLISKNTQA